MTMSLTLVYAREPLPDRGPSVFLAGPTPRAREVPSWRPAALAELAAQWTGYQPLTVLSPESRGSERAAHYDDQVDWETAARGAATSILFWIPRDLATLPGFTTNVEFGLDVGTGRAVLGCPPDCPHPERNRYLIYVARRHGVPVCETLHDTVAAALHGHRPGCFTANGGARHVSGSSPPTRDRKERPRTIGEASYPDHVPILERAGGLVSKPRPTGALFRVVST